VQTFEKVDADEIVDFMGAKVKNLTTLGERSATGMDDTRGVLVVEVAAGSVASRFLQANDVILSFNYHKVSNIRELFDARKSGVGAKAEMIVFRNQKEVKLITK
jgi:S1-C subfamily serine protease